eukprot:gb/GECG01015584.1/.p1 GENE.gb/GECG01015584.1/~~gb/GECG01015584.1/.p1  ORF type:complete len:250 (+),score=38.03 gb/GECG01015584.1/:1-750(+)
MASTTTSTETASTAPTDGKQQPQKQHKLQDSWSVHWKRDNVKRHPDDKDTVKLGWKASVERICSFDTVEKFWACWAHIPKPSQLFKVTNQEKGPFRITADVDVDGTTERMTYSVSQLSFFREAIPPLQEHKLEDGTKPNKLRLTYETTDKVKAPMDNFWDKLWEYLALTLIGESCPYSEYVTGIQMLQKKSRNWRIEIWLSVEDDKTVIDSISNTFREILKQIRNDIDCSQFHRDPLVADPDGIELPQK